MNAVFMNEWFQAIFVNVVIVLSIFLIIYVCLAVKQKSLKITVSKYERESIGFVVIVLSQIIAGFFLH